MKKLLSIAAFTCIAMLALGQDPVITFTKTTHDFGKINEADGRVTTIFENMPIACRPVLPMT